MIFQIPMQSFILAPKRTYSYKTRKSFSEKNVKIQNWRKKFIIGPFYESSLKQLLDKKGYDLE